MSTFPPCPVCTMPNTYHDGEQLVCADCGHEWQIDEAVTETTGERVYKDAHGTVLVNGDSVILIKDLKVKGSSIVVKKGTKVKNIRLVDSDHDIDCKVDGVSLSLKTEFMKKA